MNIATPAQNQTREPSPAARWDTLFGMEPDDVVVEVSTNDGHIFCGPLRGIREVNGLIVTSTKWAVRMTQDRDRDCMLSPQWNWVCPSLVTPQKHESGFYYFHIECCNLLTVRPEDTREHPALRKSHRLPKDTRNQEFLAALLIQCLIYKGPEIAPAMKKRITDRIRTITLSSNLGIRTDHLDQILAC
jgi:hypothetical protein